MKQLTKTIIISILLFSIIQTIKGQYFQGQNLKTNLNQEIQEDNLIILHKKNTPLYKKPGLFDYKNVNEFKINNNDIIRVRSNVKIITEK